jgi:hypothetical protein
MAKNYDSQYKELFRNTTFVAELLKSFVSEKFVQELDFSTIEREPLDFLTRRLGKRESDMVYKINFQGDPIYIYILVEFQSSVYKFMALRILEYIVQFYRDLLKIYKLDSLPRVFPILIYNGDAQWTAPIRFKDLLSQHGGIPEKYLPDFSYYKIAVNEIPKRALVKIRNALSAVFLVENSRPGELAENMKSLVNLLKTETPEVIQVFADWFLGSQDFTIAKEHVKTFNDLMEVTTMWATAVKEHDSKVKLSEKQEILADLIATKFGHSEKTNHKIRTSNDSKKLESALKKILSAGNREEVLKCLE